MNRAELGLREFSRVTAGAGPVATDRVRAASPVLADGVERFIFADVFSRSGLGAREREMLTCAVLATIGAADNQLGVHLPAALECGADPDDLIQLCEQIVPYAGFPRALNALRAVRAVLEERGLPLPLTTREVRLPDGVGTVVIDHGEGPEGMLFVHEPLLDRNAWRNVIRLMPDGLHCVAPDLRGAGAAAAAMPPESQEELIKDLVAVMDETGLERVRLVGIGNEGCALIHAAAQHPTVSSRMSTPPIGLRQLERYDANSVSTDALIAWFSAEQLAADGWAVRYARDRVRRTNPDQTAALARAMGESVVAINERFLEERHPHPLSEPEACAQLLQAAPGGA